jgi:hypothetical protein
MSWLFSQALVEAYSEDISLDGEQSAQSNGNPMPQAYLCSDKMMGFSRLSRFGMTFRLLTENRGEALLMSYLEGFHVRTSQPQEKVQELTVRDQACGEKWQGSFAKYDPDTHSLRTHQCSLLEDLTESCQTLPAWGLMRDGECWEVTPLELTQNETEFGFWPTPTKSDGAQHGKEKWIENSRSKRISLGKSPPTEKITYVYFESNIPMKYFPELSEELMTWPKGWTHLEQLEMDKFQEWQQQHGSC